MSVARIPIGERFWSKVDKASESTDACWLWTGTKNSKGYGVTHVYEGHVVVQVYAHRLVHALLGALVPAAVCVLHRCDTPLCVRPDHHFFGSRADNNADRDRKGRTYRGPRPPGSNRAHGEGIGGARLTAAIVAQIHERVARGESRADVARSIGVCWQTVDNVVARRTWRHVQAAA